MIKVPPKLGLHLQGGIGDCIKVVTCNFALRSLCQKYSTEILISYGGNGHNDCGWGPLLKEEIFDLTPNFKYQETQALGLPTVGDFFKEHAKDLNLERLLPLDLGLAPPVFPKTRRNIGIQLSSNDPRKNFKFERWGRLILSALEKYKYTDIYLFDDPDKAGRALGLVNELRKPLGKDILRLHNTVGNPLSKSIALISGLDLLISSDSFSKYICLCNKVPCILLCADVGFMSPSDLLRTCFLKEITYNNNYTLLGVKYGEDFKVQHMVSNINQISVEEILSHI